MVSRLSVVVCVLCDPGWSSSDSRKLLYRAIYSKQSRLSHSHNNWVPLLIRMLPVCVFLWQEQLTNPLTYWWPSRLKVCFSLRWVCGARWLWWDLCQVIYHHCSVAVTVWWLRVGNWKDLDYDLSGLDCKCNMRNHFEFRHVTRDRKNKHEIVPWHELCRITCPLPLNK